MMRSPAKNVSAPSASPAATGRPPAVAYASSVSSNDTDATRAPAPKPMTNPMTRGEASKNDPSRAPITNVDAAMPAHHAAVSTVAS